MSSPDPLLAPLPHRLIDEAVARALAEDLGLSGDLTSQATIAEDASARAVLAGRRAGVLAGMGFAKAAFAAIDPALQFRALKSDGSMIAAGDRLAEVDGSARAILMAERVALNFLSHLSGIATLTRRYVDAVAGTDAAIIDTRKTIPGLRAFQKYAVRAGGGRNHRFGLFDAVLIKDNHIAAAGGVVLAVRAARERAGHMVKIEVEVDRLEQVGEALEAGADIIMLDNMESADMREAVEMIAGRAVTEASGGVTLETVRVIAESGVDLISVGALTHSAPILDIGLDFV